MQETRRESNGNQTMSDIPLSVPSYGGTVFISYARADDEKPPFDDTA